MIRSTQRLLKYTSITHIDYQLLIDSLDKLREIARKLNEQRDIQSLFDINSLLLTVDGKDTVLSTEPEYGIRIEIRNNFGV
ncbi:unnamed protein product [Rotaria sordida]|uniref:Uncharacterized protein n=1 Tax=Rotaria sordida TaxID=392033 RepID=A0A819CVD2_9BILA|nr:unnamed protein product [Rotaria sordida]CAF1548044.1 unnamed protein product [Rotaria sordida]CAF3825911.1 unnamed protein product [Rotaria sordida]CAF4219735.1 unnamed protein product [Rotaria sordida]